MLDAIIECENKYLVGRLPPLWIFCSISVSHLLLMINSSVNFLVYCVAGTRYVSYKGSQMAKFAPPPSNLLQSKESKGSSLIAAYPKR